MTAKSGPYVLLSRGRGFGMIAFFCLRCGRGPYHADETHIGKSILCTKPGCEEVITITWQDGRCTTSNQQIKKVIRQRSKWIDEIRKNGVVLYKSKANRGVAVAVVAALLMGIGFIAYRHSIHRGSSNLKSEKPVMLSPDEVAGSGAAPERPFVQNSSGDQTTTFDSSTAVGLDNKPITLTIPVELIPAKPISKKAPKADADRIQETLPSANSPPTGTRIIPDQATTGRGELVAINGTGVDACVIVVDSDKEERVREVHIKSQDSFTLGHLNPGNYKVLFATGIDWDNTSEHFNRNASYFEFGKVLSFKEEGGYEEHTITLNPVANGNVRRRSISEAEFHALTAKR
jgi:hypothetical protein